MEAKFQIFLGVLLVFFTTRQIQCASLHHIRIIREAETTTIAFSDTTPTTEQITNSSLSSSLNTKKDLIITENENKIKSKINDASSLENEHTKIFQATTSDPNEKPNTPQENKKDEGSVEESTGKTKIEVSEEESTSKSGRSLNIDIEKYISPEFHNKNNVYSMPTSPEIEKYLEPETLGYTTSMTNEPRKTSEMQTDFSTMELTPPHSTLFDHKFRMTVEGIKQNLDEISSNTEQFKQDDENRFDKVDDEDQYEVSKLIDNYKNADNDTEINLHANEFKNIDLKSDKNKHNKGMESGKNVDYESKYFKSQIYGDKPEQNNISDTTELESKSVDNETKPLENTEKTTIEAADTQIKTQVITSTSKSVSTTIMPTKKPRTQISLRNNTIETTAPDSDIKPKSLKHFTDSSNIDPLREIEKATYTKPAYENAINISKRGSTKTTSEKTTATTVASFMDYDNKNFSIPPTATAWTLVSLKEVPFSSTPSLKENQTTIEADQNSQENNLVKIPLITLGVKEETTEKIFATTKNFGNNIDYSTTTDSTDPTAGDNTESGSRLIKKTTMMATEPPSTTLEDHTTETEVTSTEFDNDSITSTIREETTETDAETTYKNAPTTFKDDLFEKLEDTTAFNYRTTTLSNEETTMYSTTETPTTMENYSETKQSDEPTTIAMDTTTEPSEITTTDATLIYSTLVIPTEKFVKPIGTKESDVPSTTVAYIEATKSIKGTTKTSTTSLILDEDMDSVEEDNDYSEVMTKKKTTDMNDPEIDIVQTSTRRTSIPTAVYRPTTPSTFIKDQKSIFSNTENVTVDATSSTESFSHDNDADDNTGMIAAITISSIGGVCLILLAGLLLIMRKRQKRVTYGQRCRPVSLDAYSLDNVSVYNSVRRKGAMRASKRSYGNPAFDDPVSTSHQMNFQQLAKFVDNAEAMSTEFEEIPQVTARANEVPDGCETKNRYANVIPLPETRVFLKPFDNDPQSDYINANYVTGPKNLRGYYIATQGPMNSTVDDFWRMVWEQQCRVVLMLTNLYENGIEKCADYLPPSEVLDCHRLFGDFQITLKKREVKEKYIISSLQLKNMVSNSWREVTHLWYLGWPERGVPTEANSLIAFLIEARSHLKAASNNNSSANDYKNHENGNMLMSGSSGSSSDSGPLVVHCSPGTGRTGTVIACDIAIRDFELTRNVDIPKIVYKVRRDRASAVQTKEQYSFIYKVISLYATKLTGGALESI